jgi:hypothetical protein
VEHPRTSIDVGIVNGFALDPKIADHAVVASFSSPSRCADAVSHGAIVNAAAPATLAITRALERRRRSSGCRNRLRQQRRGAGNN